MNLRFALLVCLLVLALGNVPMWADSVVLRNPGFEDGTVPNNGDWWSFAINNGTVTASLDASTAPGGESYMLHLNTTDLGGVFQNFLPMDQTVNIQSAGAWVYVISGTVGVGIFNAGSGLFFATTSTTGEWILLSGTNLGQNNQFGIYGMGAAEYYVDNAFIVDDPPSQVPEPATLVMMSSGLGALGMFVRRFRK